MTRLDLAPAGKAVVEGPHDTQNSQAIFEAYQIEFGEVKVVQQVGARPSRIDKDCRGDVPYYNAVHVHSSHDISYPVSVDGSAGTVVALLTNDIGRRVSRRLPHVPLPRPSGVKRMEVSQQTPTQLNVNRDYVEFGEQRQLSPVEATTQRTANDEAHTLDPDETGAVNFDLARPSSQVSEDGGFADTSLPLFSVNADETPHRHYDVPPQTPALPKNPFGAKSNEAVPLGATQLFGQTQMMSSALKHASPTSSRPSPKLFPDTIPTNVAETSPLKNRANVSSPTDVPTSSPTRVHEIPATVLKSKSNSMHVGETPVLNHFQRDERIPESPSCQTPRPSDGPKPLIHYVPMKQSQEQKASEKKELVSLVDSEEDDLVLRRERQKRAERKRQLAAEEMARISFTRTQPQRSVSDEQRDRKRRKIDRDGASSNPTAETRFGEPLTASLQASPKAVLRSIEPPSAAESTKATPGDAVENDSQLMQHTTASARSDTRSEVTEDDMIPATSPARSPSAVHVPDVPPASEPELPAMKQSETERAQDGTESSSLPPARRQTQRTQSTRMRQLRRRLPTTSPPTAEAESTPIGAPQQPAEVASEPGQMPTTSSAAADVSASDRLSLRRDDSKAQVTAARRPLRPLAAPSSSLTNFSNTPATSSKKTRITEDSPLAAGRNQSVDLSSPCGGTRAKSRSVRHAGHRDPTQSVTRAARASRRSIPIPTDVDSADDLGCSLSGAPLDKSTSCPKWSRVSRTSLGSMSRKRLFDGMVFALSFSSTAQRTKLEANITQGGGTILHEGFQELFEPSDVIATPSSTTFIEGPATLALVKAHAECGFAALIADGHSRKAKYMQALALGLPCLAPQWVTSCVDRSDVVDWTPFLLCAGPSAALGHAIRSRVLTAYHATEARLSDVLDQRAKFLHGAKVLVMMGQRRKEARQQYLFLALALGPSLIARVSTVQQAAQALREAERDGAPFAWIYVDVPGSLEAVLAAAQESRKRRKAKAVGSGLGVLTDEWVIQSLILGRMLEPGEMGVNRT